MTSDTENTTAGYHARPNMAWRDTVTIERLSTGERLDISVAEARALSAELLTAADESEAMP